MFICLKKEKILNEKVYKIQVKSKCPKISETQYKNIKITSIGSSASLK